MSKQFTLKYRVLKRVVGILPARKIMAGTPEKTQKLFGKAFKGAQIPKIVNPDVTYSAFKVSDCPVVYVRPKHRADRLMIYLVGGGMLKYPQPDQIKEVVGLGRLYRPEGCISEFWRR